MKTVFILYMMLGATFADELPLALKVLRERRDDSANAAVGAIDRSYISKLDKLLAAATKAGRLDEALAIRAEKDRVLAAQAVLQSQPEMMELDETVWTWGKGEMVFRKDGTVDHPGWGHVKTAWKQIAPRVVQLTITGGRTSDMIAVLVIDPDGKGYAGTDFQKARKQIGKRARPKG